MSDIKVNLPIEQANLAINAAHSDRFMSYWTQLKIRLHELACENVNISIHEVDVKPVTLQVRLQVGPELGSWRKGGMGMHLVEAAEDAAQVCLWNLRDMKPGLEARRILGLAPPGSIAMIGLRLEALRTEMKEKKGLSSTVVGKFMKINNLLQYLKQNITK